MMIDLQHATSVFKRYVEPYDLSQPAIALKYVHSLEVMTLMQQLTADMPLSDEEKEVAVLIGLLHDYGRFEQWHRYGTYRDDLTIDHAELSIQLLFDDGAIRQFIDDDCYDGMIKQAISQHNKYAIAEDIKGTELLMCQLIRDADKIDNFRVKDVTPVEVLLKKSVSEINTQKITPVIYDQFVSHQLIRRETRQNELDMWLSYIAFIFDLYLPISLQLIKQADYINKLFDKLSPADPVTYQQYEYLRQVALNYE